MTHEKFEGERTLMRIHIGESDKWHGKPLYEAIVEMLRRESFSGVTVLRGVAGYGGSSIYHTDKILRLSQDLPITALAATTRHVCEASGSWHTSRDRILLEGWSSGLWLRS